ncbi:MAG: lysine decarboxylase LdcC [Parachlamydiales bacterium]|nr:lysine decarboxylase LdcC [Parachlamydiales bacterium]
MKKTILMLYPNDSDGKDKIFHEMKNEIEKRANLNLELVNNVVDIIHRLKINVHICALIYDWDSMGMKIPHLVSKINDFLPIFALSLTHTAKDLNLSDLMLNLHFFDYISYEAEDNINKIEQEINSYYKKIIPPFTKKLIHYTDTNNYVYCTPGHLAGSAFLKSPAGAFFYDFYGPNIFRADVSVSMQELGSLLDHSGPHKEAEEYIAQAFKSDRSYIVTNGTSAANKIVGMGLLREGETVLIDRNCHKSITHLLMMCDVKPIYLLPTRNAYGIIGGIPKSEFTTKTIQEKIKRANKVLKNNHKNFKKFKWPIYAVITNSTYDGLLYNTNYIKKTLNVKNIHFDGAWIAYAPFSKIYNGLYGSYGKALKNKTIFETQSTHKCLAAFSQVSMIQIKGKYDESNMNEAYMMHTTTSPQYAFVASAEMAAAMMRGNPGKFLMSSSQEIAMNFRHEIKKLNRQNQKGWFFDVWQPSKIGDQAKCWPLKNNEKWHAYKKVDSNHMFLDPIKITILTPGLQNDKLTKFGIPACIVAKYLENQRIIVEKTGPYSLFFLFSIGIDKALSLKLLSVFLEFKREFDANLSVEKMLPNLYSIDPVFYKNMKIQELAKGIHAIYQKHRLPEFIYKAYDVLPDQHFTPYEVYQHRLKGNIKKCNLKNLINEICVEMILPYPPGIPVILPGEKVTKESETILKFLLTLCEIGKYFPGFATEIHGAWREDDGEYYTKVIKKLD